MPARILDTVALRMAWLRDVVKPARVVGKLARVFLGLIVIGHAALLLVVAVVSLALLRGNPHVTALIAYRAVTAHQAAQPIRWVPLRQIPRVVRNMIVRLEDFHFYQHAGIDLGALRDAWRINAAIGRTAVGGSTIPMQLARNLFLTPRKTYFRKYVEIVIALEMDLIIPKDRILEIYLNCIEWGKGIFGIGAASSHYYGTAVGSLGLDELRKLATIITNPLRYDVTTFTGSRQMTARYDYLVSRFPDPGAEPTGEEEVAPVPDAPQPETPAEAPTAPSAGPANEVTPAAPTESPADAPTSAPDAAPP